MPHSPTPRVPPPHRPWPPLSVLLEYSHWSTHSRPDSLGTQDSRKEICFQTRLVSLIFGGQGWQIWETGGRMLEKLDS